MEGGQNSSVALERAKFTVEHCLRDNPDVFRRLPPMYVLVCDPSHYDLLPQLHQQGSMLAEVTGGVFIAAGSAPSEASSQWSGKNSDCSSIFGKDQLVRVCEAACNSTLNLNKSDLRVKVSIMCGDPFPMETFLNALLVNDGSIFTSVKYNDILGGGSIPLTVLLPSDTRCRVDLSIASYHNWAFSRHLHHRNGHILIFSAKRAASLAHAKAAVGRILDNGSYSVSGKSIFLIAIVDKNERFDDECSNLLLTEGAELAISIGAAFLVLNSVDSVVDPATVTAFVNYFNRLMYIAPQYPASTNASSRDQLKAENDGYATLTEFRNMHLNQSFTKVTSESGSDNTNSTASTGHLYTTRKPEQGMSSDMKLSASAGSMAPSVSSSSRPRRRVAPLTPSRGPAMLRPPSMAPLATPEAIDVAPEYSLVQDALTDDDHIYATLDFEKEDGSPKKEKKRPLRERMFAAYTTSPSASSNQNARMDKKSSPTVPLMSVSTISEASYRTPALLRLNSRPAHTQPLSQSTTSYEAMNQSVTTDFTKDGAVKHRRPLLVPPMDRGLRHSLSAESLVDMIRGKNKKRPSYSNGATKFVRKVATSFRMKKIGKLEEEETDPKLLGVEQVLESRSLPQSPQVGRRQMKKLGSNGEKTSSFSWLPSRSPRRTSKQVSPENQGVISPTDTLESLCQSGGGLPLFLTRCVEYIEKEGGLELEGLYRVPGNQAQLAEVEKEFRETGDIDLKFLEMPVHVVATAVKTFFSKLHQPVIPLSLQKEVLAVLDDDDVAEHLRLVFSDLDKSNTDVLRYFIGHLHKVASSPSTAMDIKNLSKVFFPTFFRPNFTDFAAMSTGTILYQRAMEAVIQHSVHIFSSTV